MQDKKDHFSIKRRLNALFTALVIVLFALTLFYSDAFSKIYLPEMTDFDSGWQDENGNIYKLSEIKAEDFTNGTIVISKKLPYYLFDGECICFESRNINLKVYMGKRRIYEFISVENVTGVGYGVAFHKVGLSREDAGNTVVIECHRLLDKDITGQIFRVYLGAPEDYIRRFIHDRSMLVVSSIMIVFFGMLLIILWLGIPDKKRQPFDVCALGVTALFVGVWCLVNTNIAQLISGHYYFWRILGVLIIPLIGYPFMVFFNSISKLKKSIYNILAFIVSVGTEVVMITLRYVVNMDMMDTITIFSFVVFFLDIILMVIIYTQNHIYCQKIGIDSEYKYFNIGLLILIIMTLTDVVLWLVNKEAMDTYGSFMRFGIAIFIVVMVLRFVSWWTKDQVDIDRDRFINRSLQFAAASRNPVESIKLLLEYLGKELDAKRTYIFEITENDNLQNVYEWFRDGLPPMGQEIYAVGTEKEIKIMKNFMNSSGKNCFVVNSADEVKGVSNFTYQVMVKNNLSNVVFSPLKSGDELIGFVGITDISTERINSIYEIMKVLPYFFSQFIGQRKEQERVIYFSYHDYLSGARNRVALKEFTAERLDLSQAFGYVLCEIDGLKEINLKLGHDVGDKIVKNTARCMMDVFGEENVYRLSGETFVAYGFENDETYFDNDVQMIKRRLYEEGSSVSVAAVFCSNGTTDLEIVYNRAYELLSEDKQNQDKDQEEF